MADQAQAQGVDLTNCDVEPIHIPGSIQPHGCMLVFDEALDIVRRQSDNAGAMLGFDKPTLIGEPLRKLFDAEAVHQLLNALAQSREPKRAGLLLGLRLREGDAAAFDVSVHRYKGAAIVEFEPAGANTNPLDTFRTLISATADARSVSAMLNAIPRLLRGVIGYDRVMIYQFAHDESGTVVAESKRSDLEGFLGLHFPASDIPKQARTLYLQNTIRLISDARGDKALIRPTLDASGEPLDLSFAHLRSVSPIHLEYLRNMGVGASMSISIIVGGALWGLIACHHYSPRVLWMAQRVAAELFGEYLSLQLEAMIHRGRLETTSKARRALDQLMRDVSYHGDIIATLKAKIDDLSALIPSDGVGLWLHDNWNATGIAPPQKAVAPLMKFIATVAEGKVWATHELSSRHPPAARYRDAASGVLAIPLSQRPKDYLLFFRREVAQTVDWAGAPEKVYETGPLGDRLTPRKSFALWKETVDKQSQPWTEDDREMAEATRTALLEIIMRHSEIVEGERQTAAVRQKLLNEELNHRVKNILALIKSLVSQPLDQGRDLAEYVESLKGRIMALAFAHDQVMRSDGGGVLRALLDAELSAYRETSTVELSGPNINLDPRAFSVMALVTHEMATNAAKYGALSRNTGALRVHWSLRSDGSCEILWKESGGPRVSPPTRRGFGSVLLTRSIPFDLHGESQIEYNLDGVSARFLIPSQFVAVDKLTGRAAGEDMAADAEDVPLTALRVMLLEDQLIIAMDAENTLLACGAKSVDTVATAEDAIHLLQATAPDVCVLDVNLGSGNSLGVAELLIKRGIPFIFATGYADSAIIPRTMAHVPTVRKPYDAESLKTAIAKAMKRGDPDR